MHPEQYAAIPTTPTLTTRSHPSLHSGHRGGTGGCCDITSEGAGMNNEREIQDEDLMDVAHDPEQAARLRKALKVLESNPNVGGKLQEMAKEVLSGRISMKDAIETRGYMDALGDRIDTIRQAAENQTPEEREEAR